MRRFAMIAAAVLVLFAARASAELCGKCKGGIYIQNIGKCIECKGMTSSGAFKYCRKCSKKLGRCEHCLAPLKAGSVAAEIKLGPEADGKTIEATVGQVVTIRLPGNPTTGFSWKLAKLGGTALASRGKVKYEPREVKRPMVGAGGMFVATFNARKPGKATISMAYARPWEKKKPEKTFSVTINVKAAAKK